MRSIWNGTISFGLVSIAVKLHSAIQESALELELLDSRDEAKIRFLRVNEKTQQEVPNEYIVKGYRLNDEYVLLDDQDFADAAPEKSKSIDIENFVKLAEINPMLFETSYYAAPSKAGQKAYLLLLEALKKSKMAGLGQFVLRQKAHLCVIYALDEVIVISRIRFAQELRNSSEVHVDHDINLQKKEMDLAMALINQYTTDFDVEEYKDTYTDDLLKIIKAKAKGKQPTIKKLTHPKPQSDDLYEQLMESLNKKGA